MRIVKILIAVIIIQFIASCDSKSDFEPSLAGNWKITSAVGNDNRHWTGSFTLTQESSAYKGVFKWNAVDGKSTGTDNILGAYNTKTGVLTMQSVLISGNIESVLYTVNVSANGKVMKGIWTGSSDGTVENPGKWSAVRE